MPNPGNNDQDKLTEKFKDLEEEFNETDDAIETLAKEIREDEEIIQDGDEETELSKFLQKREKKKDDLVGRYEQYKDNALFGNKDSREDISLMLELMKKSARQDIKTLINVKQELDRDDEHQDKISDILARLHKQKKNSSSLLGK